MFISMEVRSLQEYLDAIDELAHNYTYSVTNPLFGETVYKPHFIYRGHSNCQYGLLPGIFRWRDLPQGGSRAAYSQLEFNILEDFITEACSFIKNVPEDDIIAWLEIAQHFGVPTRLLDFTENPLVALYFACNGSPAKDACVWIINEPAYNKKFFEEKGIVLVTYSKQVISRIVTEEIVYHDSRQHYGNPNYIQYPWIYKPHYREERMHLQESIFMLWGAYQGAFTANVSEKEYMSTGIVENADGGVLCSILIPAENKKELLNALNSCGVNEKFIYPGLDGIGKYINKKYSSQ